MTNFQIRKIVPFWGPTFENLSYSQGQGVELLKIFRDQGLEIVVIHWDPTVMRKSYKYPNNIKAGIQI